MEIREDLFQTIQLKYEVPIRDFAEVETARMGAWEPEFCSRFSNLYKRINIFLKHICINMIKEHTHPIRNTGTF